MTPGPEKETTPGLYKGELEEPEPDLQLPFDSCIFSPRGEVCRT